MSMDGLMPAGEGPYPMYNNAPPDQQPEDLAGGLAIVDSIIWSDEGMDDNEYKVLTAWIQQTMMKIQAQQQQQATGGGMAAGDQAGLGSSGASDVNPFGGGAGSSDASTYAQF